MGAALARALLQQGHAVTVWNRTPQRSIEMAATGAHVAATAADAVAASRTTIVCILNYGVAETILKAPGMDRALNGRTLVQLSTGTDEEARSQSALVHTLGARYLDGGIMCFPRDIGKPDTAIVYSGSQAIYQQLTPLLRALAGSSRYVGPDPGSAMVIYLALWAFYFGAQGAFLEGAALSAADGMTISDFAELSGSMLSKLDAGNRITAHRLDTDDLEGGEAPVDAYVATHASMRAAFAKAHIKADITNAYFGYMAQAQRAGLGQRDGACAFDILAPGLRRTWPSLPPKTPE